MPDPEVVPRRSPAPRPDPADQLIQAIQGRDGTCLRRLVEVWVHRRGLDSLRHFWTTSLPPALEPEALAWLQLESVVPWDSGAAGFSPREVLDEALADYADGIGEPEQPPSFPPFAIPMPPLPWQEASAAPPVEDADPLPVSLPASLPPPPEPLLRSAPARARRLVSRTLVLLRDCLEEMWEGLAGSSAGACLEPEEALDALETATPHPAEVPPPAEPSPRAPLPLASPTLAPPLPAFPMASSAMATERLQARPRLTVPRLPRATRPAPAPADLADLRMWLPDPNEDLRRAS
ncbi:hypothetical protein NZK32_04700 [Cyanobium sp. FGCU-52]|nr:hypothetical protein [Cyanobium sp. FGCU52]